MSTGILVCGANDSGKSTFGKVLASALHYRYMDIETYSFETSAVPYSISRTKRRLSSSFGKTFKKKEILCFPP